MNSIFFTFYEHQKCYDKTYKACEFCAKQNCLNVKMQCHEANVLGMLSRPRSTITDILKITNMLKSDLHACLTYFKFSNVSRYHSEVFTYPYYNLITN